MSYVALYRQWRPQDFDTIVGQEHIRTALKNAIDTDKIAHAYLFAGPRGTGKTSTAKIIAKALNCINGPTSQPCNVCHNCGKINNGSSMDVFEIDAASNRGIDEIRDLRETVKYAAVDGKYKVYIIDEVHMLTTEAFNALLKTLEEPPEHTVFILATTEPHKIPATIHSRCQRYDFRRISIADIEVRLRDVATATEIEVSAEALHIIAVHADGGMRDALSILDQCQAIGEGCISGQHVASLLGIVGHEKIWQLSGHLITQDRIGLLQDIDELFTMGKDIKQVMLELAQHLRNIMVYKAAPGADSLILYGDEVEQLEKLTKNFTHEKLTELIGILYQAIDELKWSPQPRITAEMALLECCRRPITTDVCGENDLTDLKRRVELLENKIESTSLTSQQAKPRVKTALEKNDAKSLTAANKAHDTPKAQELAEAQVASKIISNINSSGVQDNKEIWQSVLKELAISGKRSVHACVEQVTLSYLDDKSATLVFASVFPKERTEKEDYRTILEKILAQVCGYPITISCVLQSEKPGKKMPLNTEKKVKQSEPIAVMQAQKMFGGKITKIEE